jgi:hypothetical protein
VLGPVPGSVDAPEHDLTERDLVAVLLRLVGVLGFRGEMDADRKIVLERKTPVARDVVRVRVRLDRAREANSASLRFLEVLLDRKCRVDDDRLARALVADEIRSAPESVVDELREDHSVRERSTGPRYLS